MLIQKNEEEKEGHKDEREEEEKRALLVASLEEERNRERREQKRRRAAEHLRLSRSAALIQRAFRSHLRSKREQVSPRQREEEKEEEEPQQQQREHKSKMGGISYLIATQGKPEKIVRQAVLGSQGPLEREGRLYFLQETGLEMQREVEEEEGRRKRREWREQQHSKPQALVYCS